MTSGKGKRDRGAKRISRIALFVALLAVCAQICIPLPISVPFTLQTFAVAACALFLKSDGVVAVCVYVLVGACGLPVFSQFSSSAQLFSPTGGFIVGFIPSAAAIAFFNAFLTRLCIRRKKGKGDADTKPIRLSTGAAFLIAFFASLIGVLVCSFIGCAWYAVFFAAKGAAKSLSAVLSLCVLPFLLPDVAKAALAAWLFALLRGRLSE